MLSASDLHGSTPRQAWPVAFELGYSLRNCRVGDKACVAQALCCCAGPTELLESMFSGLLRYEGILFKLEIAMCRVLGSRVRLR